MQTPTEIYLPLARCIKQRLAKRENGVPLVLGLNGAQGAGKSTLAERIRQDLARVGGHHVIVLSIDDLYLTRAQREVLADRVHPLLRTRGVPGTHDVELGLAVIRSIKSFSHGQSIPIPRFDKSTDDRCAKSEWDVVVEPVDLIIFEGWCVGSTAVSGEELNRPINSLEANEDSDGSWRRYVNEQLKVTYRPLFELLDMLVFLSVPDFDCVLRWRTEQETKLVSRVGSGRRGVMTPLQIAGFIQYYERITRHNLKTMPSRADVAIQLGTDHQVVSIDCKVNQPVTIINKQA